MQVLHPQLITNITRSKNPARTSTFHTNPGSHVVRFTKGGMSGIHQRMLKLALH